MSYLFHFFVLNLVQKDRGLTLENWCRGRTAVRLGFMVVS